MEVKRNILWKCFCGTFRGTFRGSYFHGNFREHYFHGSIREGFRGSFHIFPESFQGSFHLTFDGSFYGSFHGSFRELPRQKQVVQETGKQRNLELGDDKDDGNDTWPW